MMILYSLITNNVQDQGSRPSPGFIAAWNAKHLVQALSCFHRGPSIDYEMQHVLRWFVFEASSKQTAVVFHQVAFTRDLDLQSFASRHTRSSPIIIVAKAVL